MLLVICIAVLAVVLSSRAVRTALPFESVLAVGGVAVITMALFQLERLV